MTVRGDVFAPDEIYHVYTRGVEKRVLFLDDNDYFRFLLLLYTCNTSERLPLSKMIRGIAQKKAIQQQKPTRLTKKANNNVNKPWQEGVLPEFFREDLQDIFNYKRANQLVDILAYTLMPNHFHIVLKERIDGGVQKFMHKLMLAYAMHFNTKYNRVGALFVRPFRAKHIDTDPYFMHIFWYVHLNPIELVEPKWKERRITRDVHVNKFVRNYKWSSYYDYMVTQRPERAILSIKEAPGFVRKVDNLKEALKMYADTEYINIQSSNTVKRGS